MPLGLPPSPREDVCGQGLGLGEVSDSRKEVPKELRSIVKEEQKIRMIIFAASNAARPFLQVSLQINSVIRV